MKPAYVPYFERLKDPRWQKRRLEVLHRADFTCEHCYDTEQTLHVHHVLYRSKTMPWDYPDHELLCLCETCHKREEAARERLLALIARVFPESPMCQLGGALETLIERDWNQFWDWLHVASYPDLIAEASRRRQEELGHIREDYSI